MTRYLLGTAFILFGCVAFAQQDQGKKKGGPPPGPPLMIMIPGFKDGSDLPVKYSCSNAPAGVSPEIQWMNPPQGTQSFAILLHDPEPHPQKGIYDVTHWFMWNIPATAKELPEGVPAGADLPDGSHQLKRGNPRQPDTSGPARLPDRTITTHTSSTRWIRSSIWGRMRHAPMP